MIFIFMCIEEESLRIFIKEFISNKDLLEKVKKIKSNDRMPPRTKEYLDDMMQKIEDWDSEYRDDALKFAEKVGPKDLFEILHSIRRWYTGQTMARSIQSFRKYLKNIMDIDETDVIGIYRGFKVDDDDPIAKRNVGDEFTIPITRNHNFSSWSTSLDATNKFSGKSKGKVGVIIQLISAQGIEPVLAPPDKTEMWFNKLYEEIIGTSFRDKEGEYLIFGSEAKVKIIKLKR